MNALQNGIKMELVFNSMAEQTGYERKTTFASDFGIADAFGADAVKDTYNRAFNGWKNDIIYMTELCLTLNWACWYHYDIGNTELSKLYAELYHKCDEWCMDHFTDDELEFYLKTTD